MNIRIATLFSCFCFPLFVGAQVYNQMDESGNITQQDENGNGNNALSKHRNDSSKVKKEIPKGLYVWTVDRQYGDIRPAEVDTMPHLYMNSIFNTGMHGEYNTIGNNYSARLNRIVIDRPITSQFFFTQPYSYVMREPDQIHFINTLSPITNISYDNCGSKTNGEDHIDAKFAVNMNKRSGVGFDLNYAYARGYYSNQNTSHFGATFFAYYLGDKYQMHTVFSAYHQKTSENGGITDDNYITHPETFDDTYSTDEMSTVLSENWNRNNNQHLFFTQRYNLGFYRMEKMTEAEIKARKFAQEAKKDNAKKGKDEDNQDQQDNKRGRDRDKDNKNNEGRPAGRPKDAAVVGDEPVNTHKLPTDSTRIKVGSQAAMDSLLAAKALQDSINATMKKVYVPVTSFIHTLDYNNYDRIYQAYASPTGYYANTYYKTYNSNTYTGNNVYDETKFLSIKNTFAIALLEGFNKYAKAGLKVFASHEYRQFKMPEYLGSSSDSVATMGTWRENAVSVGGQIIKSQGKTFHYNLGAETWLIGEEIGQLKVDFSTDLNFPLLGDTVTLAAKAYFYRLHPTFYLRNYHSKYLWWDNSDLNKETRTRVEGLFKYRKTGTLLRVAIEEIQNYTYLGMSYNVTQPTSTTYGRSGLTAAVRQSGSNINLLTAQIEQNFRLGILNWENILTYQNSNHQEILPVPTLNYFTNLFIKFRIVKELSVELGGDMTWFTKYKAPDFVPQLNQFAIQENSASQVELGGYPFIDVYANLHLKHTRFFLMMSHVNKGMGNKMYFLTPHYPMNESVIRFGVSWNFFN